MCLPGKIIHFGKSLFCVEKQWEMGGTPGQMA